MEELKPITRKRLSEAAIDNIKEYIVSNNLEVGAKLPSERQLAKSLKISRAAIREALRMLEITGLVQVKPGKGIFVEALTGDLYVPLATWVSKHKSSILKHFEARLILEPEIAGLAAQRATRDDIQKLEKEIKNQEALAEDNLAGAIHADINFHCFLAEAADNWTLGMLMNSLAKYSFEGWKAALRVEGRNEKAVIEHTGIVEMIKRGDKKGAKKAMRDHMLESISRLKKEGLE
jgi:GntR family transcriptional repressor for pyruvate dehydrogenase complex